MEEEITATSFIPGDVIAAIVGAVIVAVVALAVGLSRNRERISKIEEWVRLHERLENGIFRKGNGERDRT